MFLADLHIHSRFSRATSRDCDAPHLDVWARRKGIALIGTGDFTHPGWRAELADALIPAEDGLYRLKDELRLPCEVADAPAPRFVVSGEISTIYKSGGKTRKVHHVILLPGLEAAEALSHRLEAIGNLHSDGRPILGLDSRDLLAITLEACPDAIFIPAHIWTPHFSVFGAFSDFGSIEECYGDLSPHIHALETGLSSDPPMNRRLSMLDGYTLVSNSDAHSPAKLGREANLLSCAMSYPAVKRAIETGVGFDGTIEFFPEEGKYHLDGHRNCHCCLEPSETERLDGRCPVCGRKLTVGVLHRVEALADRAEPIPLPKPFESLMPLPELLSACMEVSPTSKRAQEAYSALLTHVGPEFRILRELSLTDAESAGGFALAEGLRRLREGRVIRRAGYDGEYGVISLFETGELAMLAGQTSLLGLAGVSLAPKGGSVRKRAPEEAPAPSPTPAPLNGQQQAAVRAAEACVAVIAGPGTGKTKTLVERIVSLIQDEGARPGEITAVTFTRQAAGEMEARLAAALGKRAAKGITVGTFHQICLSLLPPKPLISRAQALDILGALAVEHDEALNAPECLRLLSRFKNAGRQYVSECARLPAWLPPAYEQRMNALGLRDLDDVLLEALALPAPTKPMFRHLLVDEFQDISPVQHALVLHWSGKSRSLFVIGDPDQAIYGFRGADAACFDKLRESRPDARIITLMENYRSAPPILECALSVISRNPGGERRLNARCAAGVQPRVVAAPDAFSEGVWIAGEIARMTGGVDMLGAQVHGNTRAEHRAFSDIAVLCRTRRQLEQIETCLVHDDIPCVISARDDFWEDAGVRGLLGFFASLLDPTDDLSLRSALAGLWRVPDALCQRAGVALMEARTADGFDLAGLRAALAEFEVLAPWLDAVEAYLPRLKEAPRKLLASLAEDVRFTGKPLDRLLNTAVFHERMGDLLDVALSGEDADLRRAGTPTYASGAVRLMTLHAAKGLEFPVVFLAGATAGTLPLERADRAVDVCEERRLFYVGITRAREELIFTCGGQPSAFLSELPACVDRQTARGRRSAPKERQLSLFDL